VKEQPKPMCGRVWRARSSDETGRRTEVTHVCVFRNFVQALVLLHFLRRLRLALAKKSAMTMADPVTLAVHRCRFVEFTPAAITALAFPPLNLPAVRPADKGKSKQTPAYSTAKFGTLAVGRANGNIEICEWSGAQGETQAPQAWVVRKVRVRMLSRESMR
jgi:hypothetical protein